ncbi:Secreted protein [Phytophthora megakarya]|uniref:Secreted protein n=1 Tax=Phytophthora megakarya TaxID=4795 RepID=A0A225VTD3_9STRA|nr:Secreted protein [Phytophthora megakarya]
MLALEKAISELNVTLPIIGYCTSETIADGAKFLLNTPSQHALSEYVRHSGISLQDFMELFRYQTMEDYRPNKNLIPSVLDKVCKGYNHLTQLQQMAHEKVEVRLRIHRHVNYSAHQTMDPHQDSTKEYSLGTRRLTQRIRTNDSRPIVSDVSSINDRTDRDIITRPDYSQCNAVATEILRVKERYPALKVLVMAGDVASAFRNVSIHSNSVYVVGLGLTS